MNDFNLCQQNSYTTHAFIKSFLCLFDFAACFTIAQINMRSIIMGDLNMKWTRTGSTRLPYANNSQESTFFIFIQFCALLADYMYKMFWKNCYIRILILVIYHWPIFIIDSWPVCPIKLKNLVFRGSSDISRPKIKSHKETIRRFVIICKICVKKQ